MMSTRALSLFSLSALSFVALVVFTGSAAEAGEPAVDAEANKVVLKKSGRRTSARVKSVKGGELRSADGQLRVLVPPAAMAESTRITVQEVVGHSDRRLQSKTYEVGPHGATFTKPVELCLPATEEQIKPGGLDGTCLAYFDLQSENWKCEDECLELRDNLVCGSTNHFTNFALLLAGKTSCGEGDIKKASDDGARAELGSAETSAK